MMIKVVSWVAVLYVVYGLLLFLLQRQMMFPRYMIGDPPEKTIEIPGFEKIWLDMPWGKVETWYFPPVAAGNASGPWPVVIYGHGNGELIDFWPEMLQPFTQMGLGLLLVEYPGYGRSDGKPSQKSITQTFIAAYEKITARAEVDAKRMILFGRSIGGGGICQLANQKPSAALILMSTFTSARSFATQYLVPGFLVKDPFDNLAVVKRYSKPTLLIHGKYDEIIRYSHVIKLHQAAANSRLITYQSGHNDCPPDWAHFWRDVRSFLASHDLIEKSALDLKNQANPAAN